MICVSFMEMLPLFQSSASEKALATERLMPPLKSSENAMPSRELHTQKKALFYTDMREELLSKPSESATGLLPVTY